MYRKGAQVSVDTDLKIRLEAALQCPIDWAHVICQNDGEIARNPPYDGNYALLQTIWYWAFASVAVHNVEVWYLQDICQHGDIQIGISGDDNRHVLKDVLARRELAVERYDAAVGWLARLSFLQPSDQKKHFKISTKTLADAVIGSRDGPSLFAKDHSAAQLRRLFWSWFLEYFDEIADTDFHPDDCDDPDTILRFGILQRFFTDHHTRFAVDVSIEIGASDGEPTKFLCFDLERGSATAHAYPVSEEEARRIMSPGRVIHADI
jgi:hypothetical protein